TPWFVSVLGVLDSLEASQSSFDVNFSQANDFIPGIGTQGVEGLSQTSYVPDFDPSQTKKGDEWWTPRTSVRDSIAPLPSHWEKWNKGKGLQLTDSPLRTDGSPQSSLYYCSEESWLGFTEWVKKPTPLPLGPSILNLSIATRIAMMKGHESRIEEMEDAIAHCEEKITECIGKLRIIKALFVCCLAMVFMYLAYA
ncbi:hypothetical protein HID58_080736, partial [Brassica napus]